MDNNQFSVAVFVDLFKAFDTLDHNILLNKLNYYGIRGIAYVKIIRQNPRPLNSGKVVTIPIP